MKILDDLTKVVVGVVIKTPAAIVADVVTLGGAMTERQETYTGEALGEVMDNIDNVTRPDNHK